MQMQVFDLRYMYDGFALQNVRTKAERQVEDLKHQLEVHKNLSVFQMIVVLMYCIIR